MEQSVAETHMSIMSMHVRDVGHLGIATEILMTPLHQLELNAKEVRLICADGVQEAAWTGKGGKHKLYATCGLLRCICMGPPSHVRA